MLFSLQIMLTELKVFASPNAKRLLACVLQRGVAQSEMKRSSSHWFAPQMATVAKAGQACRQELHLGLACVCGKDQSLAPSFAAFSWT